VWGRHIKETAMKNNFSELFIRNINKQGRYTDKATKGLNLQVKANLKKYWAFRYLFESKRFDLGLGSYPEISLKEARKRAIEARNKLNQGINPKPIKTIQNLEKGESRSLPTFQAYALTCHAQKSLEWSNTKHATQWINTLRDYAFPVIGDMLIDKIDTDHILEILEPIWTSKTETASRLRARIEWVLASASTRKLRSGLNPAIWRGHLETILPKPTKVTPVKHHEALPYKDIPAFIAELKEFDSVTALALEFLILNASRTAEVRFGLRSEIHGDVWIIPAGRMKMKKEHRVPLCERSQEILSMAKSIDPESPFLFSKNGRSLNNVAMANLTKRMRKGITVHGFRSSFRDWVSEETDHSPEVAEKALAHIVANQVEAAYRRGDLLERRKILAKDWEFYCQSGSLKHDLRDTRNNLRKLIIAAN
jgi:integrase